MSEGDLRFSSAEVNLVMHATENTSKVLKSIQDVLAVPSERFSTSISEGHFKNKILFFKAILSSNEAGDLATSIMALMKSSDRELLSTSLPEYTDEKGNLYLRLDKQKICRGEVSLSEPDAIRIRFKPIKRYKPSGNLENYRRLFSSTE